MQEMKRSTLPNFISDDEMTSSLARWEAVRAKHQGQQMLCVRNATYLSNYISNKLDVKEEQLLGADLVPNQHAIVEIASSTSCKKKDDNFKSFNDQFQGFSIAEKQHIDVTRIKSKLRNGVFKIEYKEKEFLIYVFGGGKQSSETYILTWEDESNLVGKELIAEAYNAFHHEPDDKRVWVYTSESGTWQRDTILTESIMSFKEHRFILPLDLVEKLDQEVKAFFESANVYKDMGLSWKRGILLMGPKGNGKLEIIKLFLKRNNRIPALYAESLKQIDKFGMQDIFARARQVAPCILVLEGLDTLVSTSAREVILKQLDGEEPLDGVFVVATSSDTTKLDAAFLERPSCFDSKYTFDLPNVELRRRFAKIWFESKIERDLVIWDSDQVTGLEGLLDHIVVSTDGWNVTFLKDLFVSLLLALASESLKANVMVPKLSVNIVLKNIDLLSKQVKQDANDSTTDTEEAPKRSKVKMKESKVDCVLPCKRM